MSKAFVNEDAAVEEPQALPERVPGLPITPRGLEELTAELASLEKSSWRARVIAQALTSVTVRAPALQSGGAGFGCVVVVTHDGAERSYEIVGPDEAQPERGRVSVTSPIGRALLGQPVGALVVVKKPKGDEELEIVDVRVPS